VAAHIRPALPSEAGVLRAVVRDAYTRWVARLGREPSPMQWDYARRITEGEAWVLEVEGEIVGLIELKDEPDALLISNIAVVSVEQGKGHGRRLIAYAEEEAKRRGYIAIRLYVNALMVENIGLYRHIGFTEIERFRSKDTGRLYVSMARPVSRAPIGRE
jgi:ribosomal protein S18 acetylase RimI-like enzyme